MKLFGIFSLSKVSMRGKSLKKTLFFCVIILIMSGCIATVEEPTPVIEAILTPTETSTPSITSTLEPTPTFTVTPTPTSTSQTLERYHVLLQKDIPLISQVLDWEVMICDFNVVTDKWDEGIFLITQDNAEYFCDFEGYNKEVLHNSLPYQPQRLLTLVETQLIKDPETNETELWRFFVVFESFEVFFPNPSTSNADTLVELISDGKYKSLDEVRRKEPSAMIPLRMWVLREEEYDWLIADPTLCKKVPVLSLSNYW